MSAAADRRPDLRSEGSFQRFMGTCCRELGQFEAATEHLRQALQIDPRDDAALDHLAFDHFRGNRYAQALELYEDLVKIKPGSAQVNANRAAVLALLGRYEEAIAGFERAVSLDPGLESARAGLEQARRDALRSNR